MTVLDVLELDQVDDRINVLALVDNAALRWPATYNSPAEYGPAVCRTSILLGDPFDPSTLSEDDLLVYVEEAALEWVPVELGDW